MLSSGETGVLAVIEVDGRIAVSAIGGAAMSPGDTDLGILSDIGGAMTDIAAAPLAVCCVAAAIDRSCGTVLGAPLRPPPWHAASANEEIPAAMITSKRCTPGTREMRKPTMLNTHSCRKLILVQ